MDLSKAQATAEKMGVDFWYELPEQQGGKYGHIEIQLSDFDCGPFTDKTGRNAYSLEIDMDEDRIANIVRLGHCHMCSGQGSDDELRRFPHKSLEAQAEEVLSKMTTP